MKLSKSEQKVLNKCFTTINQQEFERPDYTMLDPLLDLVECELMIMLKLKTFLVLAITFMVAIVLTAFFSTEVLGYILLITPPIVIPSYIFYVLSERRLRRITEHLLHSKDVVY